MQMVRRVFSVVLVFAAMVGLALSSHATILVSNTFNTGVDSYPASPTYSEMGVDGNSSGDLESAWYRGGFGTLDPVGAGGPLRGNMTGGAGASASWTTYFTSEGSPVNLASAGDILKLTWVFSATGISASNTSQAMRLALVNTPSAARLVADASPGSAAYSGYGMFLNFGTVFDNSNAFQLMGRAAPATSSALLSSGGSWIGLTNTVGKGVTGYANGTTYTYQLTLTRNGSGGLDILSTMSGGSIGGSGVISDSYTDATPNGGSYLFDTFALRPSGENITASIFDTSLFQVEYIAIPEPSTLVLAVTGLGLMVAAMRRRHR